MSDIKSTEFASQWTVMSTLICKDWRLFKPQTIGLFVLTATFYFVLAVVYRYRENPRANDLPLYCVTAALAGLFLIPFFASVYGGAAIAGERSDRTADFLALLPVTRWQSVISKWIATFLILAAFAAVNGLAAIWALFPEWFPASRHFFDGVSVEDFYRIAFWFGLGMSFFGIAWLLSTLTRSTAISACVSIVVTVTLPFVVIQFLNIAADDSSRHPKMGVLGLVTHLGIRDRDDIELLATAFCTILVGVISLLSGTVYYLKRIAP